MKRSENAIAWLAAALLLPGLAACGGGKDAPAAAVLPSPTAVGTVNGTTARAVIGKAGGALTSQDGLLTIDVPAGALGADTALEITPLTNTAHGGIGAGYRLGPAGQTFLVPVHLTFRYAAADLLGTAVEALGAAFQTADGTWRWVPGPAVDAAARTVTVATIHFSDWSLVKGFQIRPPSATVTVKQTAALKVAYCFTPEAIEGAGGDPLQPLGYECDITTQSLAPLLPVATASNWSVNGVTGGTGVTGTVSGGGQTATFTAPASKPTPATVAVSAELSLGTKGKTLVVSNLTITDTSTYAGTITFDVGVGYAVTGTANVTWSKFEDLGDVRRYLPSGTATATIAMPGCDPLTATVPLATSSPAAPTDTLVVYTSTNAAYPKKYQFTLAAADVPVTLQCGTPRSPVTISAQSLVVLMVGLCTSTSDFPAFTDEATLAGSWSCALTGMNGASWSFTVQ